MKKARLRHLSRIFINFAGNYGQVLKFNFVTSRIPNTDHDLIQSKPMPENNPLEMVDLQNRVPFSKESVLHDFRICCISREASLVGRREVLTGKAKFGIFGGGKEVVQVALAYAFRNGDFRSGYYRDQTLMFSLGISSLEDFFAQLYADTDNDPFSGGRQMNNHFATPLIDETGDWARSYPTRKRHLRYFQYGWPNGPLPWIGARLQTIPQ